VSITKLGANVEFFREKYEDDGDLPITIVDIIEEFAIGSLHVNEWKQPNTFVLTHEALVTI
jgi:hypothetical protein